MKGIGYGFARGLRGSTIIGPATASSRSVPRNGVRLPAYLRQMLDGCSPKRCLVPCRAGAMHSTLGEERRQAPGRVQQRAGGEVGRAMRALLAECREAADYGVDIVPHSFRRTGITDAKWRRSLPGLGLLRNRPADTSRRVRPSSPGSYAGCGSEDGAAPATAIQNCIVVHYARLIGRSFSFAELETINRSGPTVGELVMLSWLDNAWVVGIVSGIIVFLITNWLFSGQSKRELGRRIALANREVVLAVRQGIPEDTVPTPEVLDALTKATARKHALRSEELYGAAEVAQDLIK